MMTTETIEASSGAWRAAVRFGAIIGTFDPTGFLDRSAESDRPPGADATGAVEIQRNMGGINPWALLSGHYRPGELGGSTRFRVNHSGPLLRSPDHDVMGLLGRTLAVGLPSDFLDATMDGLANDLSVANRPGDLCVIGAGYDEADSATRIFNLAARLLKWTLFEINTKSVVSQAAVETFLNTLSFWE